MSDAVSATGGDVSDDRGSAGPGEPGWGRAILSGLAVLVVGVVVAVGGTNTVMTRATGLSRGTRQWVATVLFFAIVLALGWGLRRLQARGLV